MSELSLKLEIDQNSVKKASKEMNRTSGGSGSKKESGGAFRGGLVGGLLGGILGQMETVSGILKMVFGLINILVVGIFVTFLKPIFALIGILIPYLFKFFKDPIGSLKGLFSGMATGLSEMLNFDPATLQTMLDGIETAMEGVKDFFTGMLTGLTGVFSGNVEQAKSGFLQAIIGLGNMMTGALLLLGSAFDGIIGGLLGWLDSILGTNLRGIFDSIVGVFAGMIEFLVSFFTGDWEGAWTALKDIGKHLFTLLVSILESAWAILSGFGIWMWESMTTILTSSFNVLKDIGQWIWDKITGFFARIGDSVGGFFGGGSRRVNDAIITPQGVVHTAPDDYIIATRNPQSLGGGSNITINISGVIDERMVDMIGHKIQEQLRYRGGF